MTKFERHFKKFQFIFLIWNVEEAHRLLVEVYGEATLSVRTYREQFQKFKKFDSNVENKDCSGRPKINEYIEVEKLFEEMSSQPQKGFTLTLKVTQQ